LFHIKAISLQANGPLPRVSSSQASGVWLNSQKGSQNVISSDTAFNFQGYYLFGDAALVS